MVRWAAKIEPLSDSHCTGCGARIALEERGDPPVPVGRSGIDQATDRAGQLDIAGALLRAVLRPFAVTALDHVRARHAQHPRDGLHRISPGGSEGDSNMGFLPAPVR